MKRSYLFGVLLSSVLANPAFAQGLKIDPFPQAERAGRLSSEGPAAENKEFQNFTQEALRQLEEGRILPDVEILDEPLPQNDQAKAPDKQAGGGQSGSIFRVDPVPTLKSVERVYAPDVKSEGYNQAISEFDSPVLPEPVHMQPQTEQEPVRYITNVPAPVSAPVGRVQAAAQPQGQEFEAVLQRSVYEEEYMREVQQQMAATRNQAQVEGGGAVPVQGEPVSLRQVPIVVLEEKTQYQDLEPAAYSAVSQGWNVSQNQSVREALERWSAAEGVSLIWDSQVDFEALQGFSDSGAYEDAVAKLLDQHMSEGLRPVGKLYADPVTGVRVLTVKAARS